MVFMENINITLEKMILSASGWRGVFTADGDEESKTDLITNAHKIICASAAFVFAQYLGNKPLVLLGTDTRPTGKAVIEAMIPVLLFCGCDVRYAGVVAAPEIMAWARSTGLNNENKCAGFIYISASHNPVGHNGLKFGLTDGGVLAADEANKLIADFRSFMANEDNILKIENIISQNNFSASLQGMKNEEQVCASWLKSIESAKAESYKTYYDFCSEVVCDAKKDDELSIVTALKDNLAKNPLGIVCDFNGSARTVSIDKDFFSALGFGFKCINDKPGQIAHRIVPEGESLEPCARLLEEVHANDASFTLGYVPDCDGDRGNLVIWDDNIKKARTLEAQEVFALACVAEFSHMVWSGKMPDKAAVAINDPTSMRIDRIAGAFGVSVFRAEVGEANVVTLARTLREDGYFVRILGEGSAGGNITHPSAVRDPINTVFAIVKMLSVRSAGNRPGLFEIWCKYSGQTDKYRANFSLADIIASLPSFVTTPAYNKDAVMSINTKEHDILKDRYQKIFTGEWEEKKDSLKKRFGFYDWEAAAYNGTAEKRNLIHFKEAGKGGLKIIFFNDKRREIAYIWMRGSATEPVFRIMADVEGMDTNTERFLLDWQRCMIIKADRNEE
jgi:phosphoglucomutase